MFAATISLPRNDVLRCGIAETSRDRRYGLRGVTELQPQTAMLFPNATSVHTFGMRFPILVVRLDAAFTVVDVRRVRPQRFVPPIRRARHVLECHEDVDIRVGDVLKLERATAQPATALTTADTSIDAMVRATTTIGRRRRAHAGSATGSRRLESGSTSPRNSSSDRIGKSSATGLRI